MTSLIIVLLVAIGVFFMLRNDAAITLPEGETTVFVEDSDTMMPGSADYSTTSSSTMIKTEQQTDGDVSMPSGQSSRKIFVTDEVKHSIPLEEVRQGCFGRDCIPSVDNPEFIDTTVADELLPSDTVGIGLDFAGEQRFYPFNMLVTREIVNDVVVDTPLAVTYCPLCGTGVVYDRTINGTVLEFGVSGMLWQSNLLMYNRDESEDNISLWSQVLGEAVLGPHTGTKLTIVPSNVVRYTDWRATHPDSVVLNTGRIGDPYEGDYYRVAQGFDPSFDESTSPLDPTAYVFGIELDGQFRAYPEDALAVGITTDTFAGHDITITKDATGIVTITADGTVVPQIEGFWFSWVAAHPETEIFSN